MTAVLRPAGLPNGVLDALTTDGMCQDDRW
jgi:hypothetical protein